MLGTARAILAVIGGLTLFGGLIWLVAGGPAALLSGASLIVTGAVLLGAALFERFRYRSEVADRTNQPPGPGGGEPDGPLESRFQRTDEVFVDPTSGRRMRVYLDPTSGERRYRAEG